MTAQLFVLSLKVVRKKSLLRREHFYAYCACPLVCDKSIVENSKHFLKTVTAAWNEYSNSDDTISEICFYRIDTVDIDAESYLETYSLYHHIPMLFFSID
mgnify:CR=1 FL=1